MNWKEIISKYPEAFFKLTCWLNEIEDPTEDDRDLFLNYEWFYDNYLIAYDDFPWNLRNLYDFFDENEIYVEISVNDYIRTDGIVFKYEPILYDTDWVFLGEYLTRTEAEEAAFERAFEILENKL